MCRSQWEENQSKLPQNTPSTGEHTRRPVITNSHTLTRLRENRRNTRDREPPQNSRSCTESGPRESALHGTDAARMDKLFTFLFTAIGVLVSARAQVFKGKSCCFTSETGLSVKPRARASRDSVLVLESRVKFDGQRRNANDGFCALI